MSGADLSIRNDQAAEHLQLLHSLAHELERAMAAIVDDNISELEESIAQQQALSLRLTALVEKQNFPAPAESCVSIAPPETTDPGLGLQIRTAAAAVQALNLRYSILLQHASRSVAMMVSLFRSFQGELQEGAGPGLHHATWSCQV
jgi:hypothetical protein